MAAQQPDALAVAQQFLRGGGFEYRQYTARALDDESNRLARGLQRVGIGRGLAQGIEGVRGAARDAERGVDQRAVEVEEQRPHQPARTSSAATAGSVLPSRNSRNAPPPVEM